MYLIAAAVVFTAYFANVALGAFADSAVLGDLGEMIVLFAASILFVVGIIRAEAKRKSEK